MNKQPIETARDADLRQSPKAMERAATRARELALQTGTAIVVSHKGIVEYVKPGMQPVPHGVQEPVPPYGDKL